MAGAASTDLPWDAGRRPTLAAVFALGVSCVITQLALMREMLGVFAGNELVLGVALGNWLLLMGLGAAMGRWFTGGNQVREAFIGLLILTALLPPAQIVVLRGLRQFVFLRGAAIDALDTVIASFLVLLPYCLAAGCFLALACEALAKNSAAAEGAGRVYAADSLGSVAGGVLFSFVLVWWLDHATLLCVPAVLNVLAASWLAWQTRRERRGEGTLLFLTTLALGGGSVMWILLADLDASSTAWQFPAQRLLFRGNSPYGRLIVTEADGQTNFVENGVVLASTPNIEQAEESAHFALAQRPKARRVLLIGGALSGTAREIFRYPVTALDCVELDPLVIRLGQRFLPAEFSDGRLRLIEADARQYVRGAEAGYDAILVTLPDPTTAQLGRFFTHEFFQDVRRLLRPGGILSFAVGRYENYASPELARLLSCARQTAASSFQNVLLLPGARVYFLASDGPLTTDIATVLEQTGVPMRWVNRSYLAAAFAPDRLADLQRAAAQPSPVNRDFAPVLYYLHLRHWASQFQGGSRWPAILLVGCVVVYAVRLRGEAGVIFASGFAGSALEIVLLLAMQILAGSVYRQVAWVVTVFMAGLAAGAWVATRRLERARRAAAAAPFNRSGSQSGLSLLALGVAACAWILPILLPALSRLTALRCGEAASQGILLLFTFGLAGLMGAQFPLANAPAANARPAAARLYTADFVGASLGGLLGSAWLLPVTGVTGVCGIAGGLNLLAAFIVFRKEPSP